MKSIEFGNERAMNEILVSCLFLGYSFEPEMHVIFGGNDIKVSRNNFRRLVLIVATSRLTTKFDYEEFLFLVSIEQGVDGSTRFKG